MNRKWMIAVVALAAAVLLEAGVIAALLCARRDGGACWLERGMALCPWLEAHRGAPEAAGEPAAQAVFLDDDLRDMHARIDRMFEEALRELRGGPAGKTNGGPARASRLPLSMQRMRALQRQVDRIFDESFFDMARSPYAVGLDRAWDRVQLARGMDVEDLGDAYLVSVSMQGLDKDSVRVTVDGRMLAVSASSERGGGGADAGGAPGGAHRDFRTRLLLPDPVEADALKVKAGDTTLSIRAPKRASGQGTDGTNP